MAKTFSKLAISAAVAGLALGVSAQQLEEVVVTAQKRTESLQDVPISVTAISGQLIQDASIRSFSELSAYVPNFSVAENPVNTIITMRGISIGSNQSFEQSVGLFLDGVYLGRSRQSRIGLFDLEQVEVLRGPQGILFGKNTLAGAINVRSAAPEVGELLSGRIAASFESDNGEYFEGHVSGSLSDSVAMRLSVMDRSIDGYLDNVAANAAYPDSPTTDETIARIGLQWEPSDATSVGLRYTYADYKRIGSNSVVTQFAPTLVDSTGDGVRNQPFVPSSNALMYGIMGVLYPNYGGANPTPNLGSEAVVYDGLSIGGTGSLDGGVGPERLSGTDTENHEFSMNIEHEFGNGMTLTSVTGLSQYEYKDGIEADFLPVEFIGRSDDSEFDQFSQEIRLASDLDGRFSWVAGVNYVESTQEIDRSVLSDGTFGQPGVVQALTGAPSIWAYSPAQLQQIEAGFGLPPGSIPPGVQGLSYWNQVNTLSYWEQNTDSWAVFLQGTFNITENLSITAGLRYTEESKDAIGAAWVNSEVSGLDTKTADAEVLFAGPPTPATIGNFLLQELGAAQLDRTNHLFTGDRDTDQTIPAVTINWTPGDDHLLYASYTEGFKSGGFNALDSQLPVFTNIPQCLFKGLPGCTQRNTPGTGFEYDDETAWSFEVGGKHSFLDGRMRVNWAYYNSEYDDQQVSTFVGLGFVVTNAASTEISGFELDTAFQVTDKLRLNLSVGTVDGEYADFKGAACTELQAADLAFANFVTPGGLTPSSPNLTSADGLCSQLFDAAGNQTAIAQDLSGRELGTAKWSGSFGAQFVQPIGAMAWFTELDVQFVDDYLMTGDLDPIDSQEAVERINLRTGLQGENWMVMLYGRNITNENLATGGADVPLARGSHMRYLARGEVFGIQVAWEF
jgi:outer membrane receptor protein involved in Fe transport